jgi:hypothetical protein
MNLLIDSRILLSVFAVSCRKFGTFRGNLHGGTMSGVRYLATVLIGLLLTVPAISVELFRYRGAAKDGGTLEYVFDTDEQDVPKTVTEKKVAEIAADFITSYYGIQVGALETQEFRTTPLPFWLVCFSDTVKGPLRQMFFVVVLPDGKVVEPSISKRL